MLDTASTQTACACTSLKYMYIHLLLLHAMMHAANVKKGGSCYPLPTSHVRDCTTLNILPSLVNSLCSSGTNSDDSGGSLTRSSVGMATSHNIHIKNGHKLRLLTMTSSQNMTLVTSTTQ